MAKLNREKWKKLCTNKEKKFGKIGSWPANSIRVDPIMRNWVWEQTNIMFVQKYFEEST